MRRLLILPAALVALLAAAAPASAARATSAPTWQAWGLTIDFPTLATDAPEILYTVYVGNQRPDPAGGCREHPGRPMGERVVYHPREQGR